MNPDEKITQAMQDESEHLQLTIMQSFERLKRLHDMKGIEIVIRQSPERKGRYDLHLFAIGNGRLHVQSRIFEFHYAGKNT